MDDIFKPEEKKPVISKVFLLGALVALAAIAVAIWALSQKPPMEEQTAKILEGSYREGSPEFAAITKDIIISNDNENTVESPMGMGTISMFIKGKVHNKGTRTISALEVNVAVVTQQNFVIREKNILVVPIQQPSLPPGQT